MPTTPRIRTPLRRYWQLLRRRVVPLVLWAGAIVLVARLWTARVLRMDAPAQVEALRQATLAPVQTGTIARIAVALSDQVRAGQVLVNLDDSAIRAELGVAEAELARLQAELPAAQLRLKQQAEERQTDYLSRARNYAIRMERLRLEKLNLMIELENEQVNAERLDSMLQRQQVLHRRGVLSDQALDDVRYRLEASRKKIKATRDALAVIEGQIREARARGQGPEPPAAPDAGGVEIALAPLRRALDSQLQRIGEIRARRRALTLSSPIDGVVTAVYHWEGETVRAGEPIVQVADPRSFCVVSYVEPGAPIEPAVGMQVEVRRNTSPMQIALARIIKVGAQFERMPWRLAGPSRSQRRWGRRVLIEMPPSMRVPPGGAPPGLSPPHLGETLLVRFFAAQRPAAGPDPRPGTWHLPRSDENAGKPSPSL